MLLPEIGQSVEGVGWGGVRKEGQKFSCKLQFEIFVRNTRGILSRLADTRV